MRKKMADEQRNAIREKILDCTISLIEKDGFEGVSVRKVAELADYTPGSIYQYFENKEGLIREVIKKGYGKIIDAISNDGEQGLTIEKQIREKFKAYTIAALEMPDYYKAVMLSEDKDILNMTSVLGNMDNRTIEILEKAIKKGIDNHEFRKSDPKIMARIIWASNFGLTMRMITEKIQDLKMINTLIEEQFDLLFEGIKKESR